MFLCMFGFVLCVCVCVCVCFNEWKIFINKEEPKKQANLCLCLCLGLWFVFLFLWLWLWFLDVKLIFFFFKDWVGLGHGFRLGPEVAGQYSWVPIGWVWGKKKKICLLNRPGSGNGGGPTGRVRVSKNSP